MNSPLSSKVSGGSVLTALPLYLFCLRPFWTSLSLLVLLLDSPVSLHSALAMQAAVGWLPGGPPEGGQGQGQAVGAEKEEEARGTGGG